MLCIFLNDLFTAVTEWAALENENPLFQLIFYLSKMKSSGISSDFRETYLFSLELPASFRQYQLHNNFSGQAKLPVGNWALTNNVCENAP